MLDYISIPRLPKCDGAVYVTGDSMYPLLKSGDIVLYKEVSDIKNENVLSPIKVVKTYDFNPRKQVVMRKSEFSNNLSETYEKDNEAFIQLTNYKPNHLEYEYVSSNPQYVVFSEIYYGRCMEFYVND